MQGPFEIHEFTMMISGNATKIGMTGFAQKGIEEGSKAEYVCETDCASTGPPIVLWYVADKPVNINHEQIMNKSLPCGDYNGQKTKSTLQLTIKREMNNKNVKCALENDDTKLSDNSLDITCKYLLVLINQVKI